MRLRGIVKAFDQRMVFQRCLDDAALHAAPSAVNQPNLMEARFMRGVHILFNN